MAKQYRPRAKNLAVARVREKDDIANRLKMHIAQAQAQLETVMGEEEEQADIGQAELPSATAVQEKFNQLVLD